MYINQNYWSLTQSTDTSTNKLPILRIDVSSNYEQHTTREKRAVIHAVACNVEWFSKDTDHWTVQTDSFGVAVELVSREKEELERAIKVINTAINSAKLFG